VKSDDEIFTEVTVNLLSDEISRTRLAGLYSVKDKVDVTRKSFDLGLISCFYAVFDRQVMKVENIQQDTLRFFDPFRRFT
jgi:hypothetical protein